MRYVIVSIPFGNFTMGNFSAKRAPLNMYMMGIRTERSDRLDGLAIFVSYWNIQIFLSIGRGF